MHLKSVRLRNFRSFWSDKPGPSAELELCSGVNYLAGPNNTGKSNLLRALAFALDPKAYPYDPESDRPQGHRTDIQSTVTVEFDAGPRPKGPVATLLRYLEEYEGSVPGFAGPSLASRGLLQLHVQAWERNRVELFLAAKAGARKGDDQKLTRALQQFRRVVRFVDIRSGEDLESLLKRGFKEVLGTVIGEEHTAQMDAARKARDEYVSALGQVLRPLSRHVQERIQTYVRDVKDVDLIPFVPELEDAIAGSHFVIEDNAKTGLDQKGTGVRGATLLMLLSFIAEASKRAVVLAIEEPESFLHPHAHRALGEGLEQFTRRDDVSLLVTTHSPFIFRAVPEAALTRSKLFHVFKDPDGRSRIDESTPDIARRSLLGMPALAAAMERLEQVSENGKLILVVEGWSDRRYLEIASEKTGTSLAGIDIVHCQGAADAAFQATLTKALHGKSRLVVALFDDDTDGVNAQNMLLQKAKPQWQRNKDVLSYKKWLPKEKDVEAEDLFPSDVLQRFLADGGSAYEIGRRKLERGDWHHDFSQPGKAAFLEWLPSHVKPEELSQFVEVIQELRRFIARAAEATTKAAAAAARDAGTPEPSV